MYRRRAHRKHRNAETLWEAHEVCIRLDSRILEAKNCKVNDENGTSHMTVQKIGGEQLWQRKSVQRQGKKSNSQKDVVNVNI